MILPTLKTPKTMIFSDLYVTPNYLLFNIGKLFSGLDSMTFLIIGLLFIKYIEVKGLVIQKPAMLLFFGLYHKGESTLACDTQ